MTAERRVEIARLGGIASHSSGNAHESSSEEARTAQRKTKTYLSTAGALPSESKASLAPAIVPVEALVDKVLAKGRPEIATKPRRPQSASDLEARMQTKREELKAAERRKKAAIDEQMRQFREVLRAKKKPAPLAAESMLAVEILKGFDLKSRYPKRKS